MNNEPAKSVITIPRVRQTQNGKRSIMSTREINSRKSCCATDPFWRLFS